MSDLTCRELIGFLDDYVADELPAARRRAFDDHLALCRDCREFLTQYRRSIELVGSLRESPEAPATEAEVPESLVRAVLEAFRAS